MVVYHDFDQAKNSSLNYGTEWNFLYTRGIIKNLNFLAKAAYFKKGDAVITPADNTTKYWLQLNYAFK